MEIDCSKFETPESVIIDLRSGKPLEIQEKEGAAKPCVLRCRNIVVDQETRTVECKDCGCIVDPFAYLLFWATEGTHRLERLKQLEAEIRLKRGELEKLGQVLAREKARIRKINPDAPEVVTWKRQIARFKESNP